MSPALIQLFAFMTSTFLLGLFFGWAMWRYGGVSRAAIEDLEAKVQFWKKSLDQSRMELWALQDKFDIPRAPARSQGTPMSRRRIASRTISEPGASATPSDTAES